MAEISAEALEACRHMGYQMFIRGEESIITDASGEFAELPRPDEDHGDCMRYLLFVLAQGFTINHLGIDFVRFDPGDAFWIVGKDTPLKAVTAACNAAMRAVAAESEGARREAGQLRRDNHRSANSRN